MLRKSRHPRRLNLTTNDQGDYEDARGKTLSPVDLGLPRGSAGVASDEHSKASSQSPCILNPELIHHGTLWV